MNHATVDDLSLEEYPRGVAMIRGHDGSYVKAYKDFRDELLLELERRIFNNIKVEYDINRLDINEFLGGEYRKSEFTRHEVNSTLLSDFIQWTRGIDKDYTVNDFYNINNSFTFNFSSAKTPLGNDVPGFWRGAYLYAYGTDRPNATPWEMLGFTMKPSWWDTTYGPAPYSGDNLVLWRDLEEGRIKVPGVAEVVNKKYARPGLTSHIPVDSQGRLKSPEKSSFARGFQARQSTNAFKFGDVAPVESAYNINTVPKDLAEELEIDEKRMNIIGQNGNDGLHYDNIITTTENLTKDEIENISKEIGKTEKETNPTPINPSKKDLEKLAEVLNINYSDENVDLDRLTDTTQTLINKVVRSENEKNKNTLKYKGRK